MNQGRAIVGDMTLGPLGLSPNIPKGQNWVQAL